MMKTTTLSVGTAPFDVYAQVTLAGNDINVAIGGGPAPHIGGVAVGVPRVLKPDQLNRTASASVYCVTGHRDDEVARTVALRLAARFNQTAAVSAGIHLDNATRADIDVFLTFVNQLTDCIEQWIEDERLSAAWRPDFSPRARWDSDTELIAVDESGVVTGSVSRTLAHSGSGVLHQAFAVLLVGTSGEAAGKILLTRRSSRKRLWARSWADSCAGHAVAGEDLLITAQRRVSEELGLHVRLVDEGSFFYREVFSDVGIEYEHCHLLTGKVVGEFNLNPDEVAEIRFVSPGGLAHLCDTPPADFAPWLVLAVRELGIAGLERLAASE
jgi:isopentenyl-diphosphate delta-isomerase